MRPETTRRLLVGPSPGGADRLSGVRLTRWRLGIGLAAVPVMSRRRATCLADD